YVKDYDGGLKVLLVSSFDIAKGKDFVIFGQQHSTKNSRFVYINMNNVRYEELSHYQLMPPRAYKKGLVRNRSEGTYVAK
ncbi:MAG: hypothetical protein J7L15_03285, partial [Clostridiales bacterium]|nr:hypothetical protein [Clostridiales bacterium]